MAEHSTRPTAEEILAEIGRQSAAHPPTMWTIPRTPLAQLQGCWDLIRRLADPSEGGLVEHLPELREVLVNMAAWCLTGIRQIDERF